MSERFIKFIPSEEAMYLLTNKGHAFRLLTIIAESARRYEGGADGLNIGEAFIGGFENYDMTESNYRSAKDILIRRSHIEIVETCRTRKKVTTGVTTVSTKVKLLSTSVYDINSEVGNDRSNDRPTTDPRPTHDKLRKNKKVKKEKEDTTTKAPPSKSDDGGGGISFNFEIGSFENISPDDISSWKMTYPDVDVQPQIRQMQEWVMADPKDREKKSWKRFIVGWLSRNQEKMAIAKKMNPEQKSRAFLGGKHQSEYDSAW